jgi:hypothetical protein
MIIQYIQKMMVAIVQEILTALIEGMIRFGCAWEGIVYED